MNAETVAIVEPEVDPQHHPDEMKKAAEEAARFLMRLAADSDGRERFIIDKEAFLTEADLSEVAKELIVAPDSAALLRGLHEPSAAMCVVIILAGRRETSTHRRGHRRFQSLTT